MTLPLAGLRVLDLTNVMAGPFCAYQLVLLGAEVIKVEKPETGDLARELGADAKLNRARMGASFLAQNAGKKSVTLNLKSTEGRALFHRLVAKADAVVESFRPGVMKRLGCEAATLRAVNPKLVYCAISGFGQTGPLSGRPAYDQIVQGLSGIMSVTGDETTAPLRAGFPVSDAIAGLNAAMAICAGLTGAARTGEGATLDVSMLDSSVATAAWVVSNYLITGQVPMPMGNENRTASPSGTFKTADGLLNISANKQQHWETVADVLGLSHLRDDPRFRERDTRKENRHMLNPLLEEVLRTKSAAEWERILNDRGVPAGRVLSVPDVVQLDQLQHRDFFRTFASVPGVDRPITVANGGIMFEDEGRGDIAPPARLGQHNAEVFGTLGLDAAALKQLEQEKVI